MAVDYRAKIVSSALSHVNTVGGKASGDDKFINYYNSICGTHFDVDTTPWCAIFVTYNIRKSNVPVSVCPSFAGCTAFRDSYMIPKKIWKLRTSGYVPKPADLIFFNWNKKTNVLQHVGIVEKVVGSTVYTIEGNSKDSYGRYAVRHKSYPMSSAYIVGYGAIPYESIANATTTIKSTSDATISTPVKTTQTTQKANYSTYIQSFQKWLNANFNAGIKTGGVFGQRTHKYGIIALQTVLNRQFNAGIAVTGSWNQETRDAVSKYGVLKYGARGDLVYIAQGFIYGKGISAGGFDGKYGMLMRTAVGTFQTQNGIPKGYEIGPNTWAHLVA